MAMNHNFVVGRVPCAMRAVSEWPKLPEKKEKSWCSEPWSYADTSKYKVGERHFKVNQERSKN